MRNATLDYARLVAASGIVIFHSGAPGSAIGYAALPFFIVLLVGLAWTAAERAEFSPFAQDRLRRLLLPWLIWSAVYGTLKLLEAIATGKPVAAEFAAWMWLAGPSIHLWFLPFAAAVCLLLWPLAHVARSLSGEARTGLSVLLTGAAVAAVLMQADNNLPWPFAQWAYGASSVLLGAAFAVMPKDLFGRAALISGTTAALAAAGWPQGGPQLVMAGAALWLCLALPLPDSTAARTAATLSLTVYLAHPLVASVLERTTPLPEASLALAFATLALTLVFASALAAGVSTVQHGLRRTFPTLA